jgi:hypothetical protein
MLRLTFPGLDAIEQLVHGHLRDVASLFRHQRPTDFLSGE